MKGGNILEMRDICKSFSGVDALKSVALQVAEGEVHALVGENGAGKSTLIKILTGVYMKDKGTILFDGKPLHPKSPHDTQKAGISPIYQELNLIPDLTVAENIFLGHMPRKWGRIDWKELFRTAEAIVRDLNIQVDVRAKISTLGAAIQQMVAIVRAIRLDCKLLVMDEPTSSLDTQEVASLMQMIRTLTAKKVAVIFISHRLDEIFEICDRVTILKDGSLVGTYDIQEIDRHKMVSLMIGREFAKRERLRTSRSFDDQDYIFEMEDVQWFPKIQNMSIRIKPGEILGLSGLLGAGRTESAKVFFGYIVPDSGSIKKEGVPVKIRNTTDAVNLGLAMCPEERRAEGIIPNMSVKDNMILASLRRHSRFGFLAEDVKKKLAEKYIRMFSIKTPGENQLIKNLSGGNQQKVILGRWLATNPQLIILDEPTRGIDIGAKAAIEDLIQEFAGQGISVLYISSELEELVMNCDRVLVMRDGSQVAELKNEEISRDAIMRMMAKSGSEEERSE